MSKTYVSDDSNGMFKNSITVITNNQPRLLLSWDELTEKEQGEFDYLKTEEERGSVEFFRYLGRVFDYCEFTLPPGPLLKEWDGYINDTYFSGICIRHPKTGPDAGSLDHVIVGRWFV